MYRYIEERNYAETCRYPDKVVKNNEKFFRTLKEAKDYAKKKYPLSFIQTERFNYAKFEKHDFKYNKDNRARVAKQS